MFVHIPIGTPAVQHAQAAHAPVHDLSVANDPFGGIAQKSQHLVAVAHVGNLYQFDQPLPVDAERSLLHQTVRQRKVRAEIGRDVGYAFCGKAAVGCCGAFGRAPGGDMNRFQAPCRIFLNRFQRGYESLHALAVRPVIGFRRSIPLTKIDPECERVGNRLFVGV